MTHTQANEPNFVLVPREPTEAMIGAGVAAGILAGQEGERWAPAAYQAMLDTAPIVPAPAYGVKADEIAKLVWEAMQWGVGAARPYHGFPDWMEGGNSLAQEKARDFERRILSCLSSAPVEEADAKAGEPNRDIIRSIQEGFAVAFTPPASTIPSEPEAKGEAGAGPVGEVERLREYAREATKAITSLTAGGSEYFGRRIGDIYTADLPFCLERIQRSKELLHSLIKDERTRSNAAEAALSETRERLEKEEAARASWEEQYHAAAATAATYADFWEQHHADPDKARLDWLEANSSLQIQYEGFEGDVWRAYRVNGGRSDREWNEIAEGGSLRDVLDRARAALSTQESSAALAGDGKEAGR